MLTVMITPLAFSDNNEKYSDNENRYLSYEEKKQKELDRLDQHYTELDPRDGGYHGIELVDFQQIILDEITDLENGLVELDKVIDIKIIEIKEQNKIIQKENAKIAAAKEQLKKDWNAAPVNDFQLKFELEKLQIFTDELVEIQKQYKLVLKQIDTKNILYEIQKNDAQLIGIELSRTCIAMAKTGISTCPTYEDLIDLDKSITSISGVFSMKDGWLHREVSNYKDSYKAYQFDDTIRIIVDPPHNEATRMKMITIVSNFNEFADRAFATKIIDNQRTLGKERIITDNCYNATISADNWKMLLPDTIFTFRNGCQEAEISDFIKYDMPKTEIDIWSSPNIQYSQWLLEMKEKCKVLC